MKNLLEIRKKYKDYLKKDNPDVPPYILKDVFYDGFKFNPEFMISGTSDYEYYQNILKKYKWDLKTNFTITMNIFDDYSENMLKERIENVKKGIYADWIPNDKERHLKQKELIEKKGIPTEPIVLEINEDELGKYFLWEGWHRVIQLFIKYPEGFTYPKVYVATLK